MTLIAEDLLLLLLDDESGKPVLDDTRLSRVLAGALLMDLALDERISPATEGNATKGGRLVVRNSQPSGDQLLDRAVSTLNASKPMKPVRAVEKLQKGLRQDVLSRLASQGLVREERGRALGIFPTTHWPATDPAHESRLRAELSQVLVHGMEPTQRTAALASLLSAVDAVSKVVPSDDRRAVKLRAKQIAEGEWAGVAVRKAIEAVNAAVATAAVVATSSGG
ncbi:MAG TPA: GPP34 family phosphoprotein [Ilumatobacteraceae bacterium]|nr:GPP34 family phosphoprotein [Ilumatobacteraceae bacterium]